jgi:hypothetical protein
LVIDQLELTCNCFKFEFFKQINVRKEKQYSEVMGGGIVELPKQKLPKADAINNK